jgi:hypothetical protein
MHGPLAHPSVIDVWTDIYLISYIRPFSSECCTMSQVQISYEIMKEDC